MKFLKIKDIFNFEKGVLQSTKCTPGKYNFITAASEWKTHNEYTHDCEALIFAAAASGSLGRTHYVNDKFVSSDLCFIITPKNSEKLPVDLKFYHLIFEAFKDEIVRNTKSGTSKEAIGLRVFGNYKLPYFNIKQQVETREKFVNAQKSTLGTDSEFSHQLSLVTQLRQSFLREAMQGKLVEQNPADEPASELLARIKAEKDQLIKEKKIRKQKPLPPIEKEEFPFEVPESWEWCRLGEITLLITDGKHGNCHDEEESGYYFLSAKDLQNNEFVYDGARQITCVDFQETHKRTNLEPYDLCVVNTGATIGKTVVARDEPKTYKTTFQKSVAVVKFLKEFTDVYFMEYLIKHQTPTLLKTSRGSAINNLLLGDMRNMHISLPPFSEQKRIVAKLDELMTYCDQLEESIRNSQMRNEMLLGQVLREALE